MPRVVFICTLRVSQRVYVEHESSDRTPLVHVNPTECLVGRLFGMPFC